MGEIIFQKTTKHYQQLQTASFSMKSSDKCSKCLPNKKKKQQQKNHHIEQQHLFVICGLLTVFPIDSKLSNTQHSSITVPHSLEEQC